MHHRVLRVVSLALLLAIEAIPTRSLACTTCGCFLSTDAAMGFSTDAGWRLSLQYDFVDQRQLRTGHRALSASQVAAINDAGGGQEVEHDTLNRTVTLGLDYAPDADWNVRLLVPYIDRSHSTYGSATNPLTDQGLSSVRITGLGDLRLIVTWQGLLEDKGLGLQAGVKLPTGDYGGANASGTGIVGRHPAPFDTGPLANEPSPGNLVDASLQAGTGSNDAIVGVFYRRSLSPDFEGFVTAQFQAAVATRLSGAGQDFRPGNTASVTVGARHVANGDLVPQLQVNVLHKGADRGALADNPDSAGTVATLSPGATLKLARDLQGFAFAQLPIYSHLVGIQLAPRWTASAGLSYAF
jgi:hypothetical protein